MTVDDSWYLILSALLFTIGAAGLLVRRNPLVMFMCVELMLNAVNLTFVTFARALDDIGGQVIVFFVLVVAAAEVLPPQISAALVAAALALLVWSFARDVAWLRHTVACREPHPVP